MQTAIGRGLVQLVNRLPWVHRKINKLLISKFADGGVLPGPLTTKDIGQTALWEMLDKEYFSLVVPSLTDAQKAELPPIDELVKLFERNGPADKSRVSLLLPLFAQHLTDAVFQSADNYRTDAPHEIILNQIYGNTREDQALLRSNERGKLRTQEIEVNGRVAEYPDKLFEKKAGKWVVRKHYQNLSYLKGTNKAEKLLEKYNGDGEHICATALFQGNMTSGNFVITTLLIREHNRLCDGIIKERERKGLPTDDEVIFKIAQQNNIVAYMKVVIEDYINAFAGAKLFILDTKSFFYEEKRWCRETPIPYHFNILYRLHSMMPDQILGLEAHGFSAMGANNKLVMDVGVGKMLEYASRQPASKIRLGNTHKALMPADRGGVTKARDKLGSLNAHRKASGMDTDLDFDDLDPRFSDTLRKLYKNDASKIDYAVGILAELPKRSMMEKLGLKHDPIMGSTLMNAIAKHAFRHILSNRFMTREYLNPAVMSEFGWENLHNTSTVADIVKRNVAGEMDQARADQLDIGFNNPL